MKRGAQGLWCWHLGVAGKPRNSGWREGRAGGPGGSVRIRLSGVVEFRRTAGNLILSSIGICAVSLKLRLNEIPVLPGICFTGDLGERRIVRQLQSQCRNWIVNGKPQAVDPTGAWLRTADSKSVPPSETARHAGKLALRGREGIALDAMRSPEGDWRGEGTEHRRASVRWPHHEVGHPSFGSSEQPRTSKRSPQAPFLSLRRSPTPLERAELPHASDCAPTRTTAPRSAPFEGHAPGTAAARDCD